MEKFIIKMLVVIIGSFVITAFQVVAGVELKGKMWARIAYIVLQMSFGALLYSI